jgi:hypothetical protein
MSAVRRWLETIGLAQYADAFDANDIDMDLELWWIYTGALVDGRCADSANRISNQIEAIFVYA